ncbi:hypothetical protein FXO38_10908 [Capsicum annuum]|nr:hypothetical protein FXO38_10908 [Capsicum annuum]KAF3663942.1 hypothetical protein FXO37_11733 [Capsicum annuum]
MYSKGFSSHHFEEWKDFLLFYPYEDTLENIYQYWERVCLVDIGNQAVIPEGISKHVHAAKYLIAGGVAGGTSHTITDPLDPLKNASSPTYTYAAYNGISDVIQRTVHEEGRRGFYKGL